MLQAYQTADFAYQGAGLFAYQEGIAEIIGKIGGDDRPRARKHRGFDLQEWKKARRVDDDIEATIKRVWAEIKGDAPAPVFEAAAKVVIEATPKTIRARREVDWQAFTREWENVYRLMQVYDDWQREDDDIEFLLLNG